MKHAILITAYQHFDHLLDIIHCFDDRFEFYIHIDDKISIPKDVVLHLQALPNVKEVSTKYKVKWGGINHLKAILRLCEQALSNKELSTFHLITGQDFPVKTPEHFIKFFGEHPKTNYLNYHELPTTKWKEGGLNRLEYYHLYDVLDAKKYRSYIFKIVELQKTYGIKRCISNKTPKLYGGETYWSLNRETIAYVLDYTKKSQHLLKRLKYTFCAEEIYFQTVIMNSEFSGSVENDSLRYIDWNDRNGNHPANLDDSDFEPIAKSNNLFARKFEFPVSMSLKERIKKEVLNMK